VFTESWVAAYLFCPACGAGRIARQPNNLPVADFWCGTCREEFELKSKKGRMGPKVADGAYGAKMARLASDTNPNLALMSYDLGRFAVTDRAPDASAHPREGGDPRRRFGIEPALTLVRDAVGWVPAFAGMSGFEGENGGAG
jgi:hypothetical protein